MPPNSEVPPTSLLLIDGNDTDRNYFAKQLKGRSPDYEILEATDGESGLLLYRSRRIDCVVLEVALPDDSGFPTLVNLVPIASKPQVPVIVLTQIPIPNCLGACQGQRCVCVFAQVAWVGQGFG